jgi:protein ImuB
LVDPERPFVLTVDGVGGPHVAALNAAAEADGVIVGDKVADVRAKVGGVLQVQAADSAADQAALRRLALWATRYTPAVSAWGEDNGADGFFLDVTGASHLAGGEERLLANLLERLGRFGLPARLAIADTPGAAWALSHFHSRANVVLPSGHEAAALAPLPVAALRLSPNTCTALRLLGLKRAGALIDKPRAPLAARFPAELLKRLDQALGCAAEPLAFIAPPPTYSGVRQLLEPITTQDAVVTVTTRLMEDLVPALVRDGVGARSLQLVLYRVDGEVAMLDIGLAAPTRHPAHVAHLVALKLERIVETIDAGFGFEAVRLAVVVAERMEPRQDELGSVCEGNKTERRAALIDSLRQRLGARRVRQLAPVASHLPERAEVARAPAGADAPAWPAADDARPRPVLLLPRAEPADEVVAMVPEGPPRRFRWRGVLHSVIQAQGPERIASEWWRHRSPQPTRDYYVVENEHGRRFWLYREGLYGRETDMPARWFVHGLFS